MKHINAISFANGTGVGDDDVNGMLERIFGFVMDLVEEKGKGDIIE